MSKISFLLPATYSYAARIAKRFQITSAEERSNEKFPIFSFKYVQNAIILYIFEAEGGGVRLTTAGKFPSSLLFLFSLLLPHLIFLILSPPGPRGGEGGRQLYTPLPWNPGLGFIETNFLQKPLFCSHPVDMQGIAIKSNIWQIRRVIKSTWASSMNRANHELFGG